MGPPAADRWFSGMGMRSSTHRLSRAVLVLAAALLACGGRAPEAGADPEPAGEQAEPVDLPAVVRALSRTHADLRARVGPHRLHYTFEVRMAPERPAPDPAPAGPGHARPVAVRDQVALTWTPQALDFAHHNDGDRGRWFKIVGERMYTRLPHRPWHVQDLETDSHELWLDEAARGAADALAFVAPALDLGEPESDGELRTFSLALRDEPEPTPAVEGPGAWRAALVFSRIEGTLILHGPSATLRSLELAAEFARPARAGEPAMSGTVRFSGQLEPAGAGELRVEPPPEATPVPERRRLVPLQRRVLRGLAAPEAGE